MADKVVKFTDPDSKWERFKAKTKEKYNQTKEWCEEHKELVLAAVPVVIGGVFEVIKTGMKYHDRAEEREAELKKRCSEWDPKVGSYVDIVRPLTGDEKEEIARRTREEGVTKTELLKQMGLLA